MCARACVCVCVCVCVRVCVCVVVVVVVVGWLLLGCCLLLLLMYFFSLSVSIRQSVSVRLSCSCALTLTWLGCYGLCPRRKLTELALPFYLLSVSVLMALSTSFHSMNSPDNSPFFHSVLPAFSLPCWSFQLYVSS